jgi:hypothetical protein
MTVRMIGRLARLAMPPTDYTGAARDGEGNGNLMGKRRNQHPNSCKTISLPAIFSSTISWHGGIRLAIGLSSRGDGCADAGVFQRSLSFRAGSPTAGNRQQATECHLFIYGLVSAARAGLIDLINVALDGPLAPRRFPQSTPLQHFQKPCE